ncbi:MAG: dihydrodipicolinate synthase family protein [Lentisphaerae bacterium]|jgi:2-dehydro-3-deoxy-D-pentonate aldolase|nr:dihydrodipicolinate synthase family protein [Lentisphaerota bacterium]MBT4817602.1 dihydrodipicolinate synthase family protein [Lentisphaerota bacterium]MBT5612398.1 dihydrodipicolinate synthase family protein [Lentisphaerota bacterium]MBT7060424.1 dihydrodipicolinate synthase family protein [Lentisphaerota bacterium]MBT7844722.1 dihydrodipicolinate synthase family protein [Lentisphaerota bacterium]
MNDLSAQFRGIIPPLVTPLAGRDELDVEGLERLVEHVLAGGVHGLFMLGTTGEGPSLGYRLRREVIAEACRIASDRVPVLVGITDTAFVESLAMAECAADAGASAVVLAPPYYFPEGQPELLEYLHHLVPELPLPLFLYNMPMMTKVCFAPETVCQAMDIDGIVGIKDSSGDLGYFRKICAVARQRRPEWSLLMGTESFVAAAVELGAHGGVCGGANVAPRLFVDFYEAALARDEAGVAGLANKVADLGAIYGVGRHASSGIKGIKCALSVLGICSDFMAEPFHRFHDVEREQIHTDLEVLAAEGVEIGDGTGA